MTIISVDILCASKYAFKLQPEDFLCPQLNLVVELHPDQNNNEIIMTITCERTTGEQTHVIALVGDSDVARWPEDLWPTLPSNRKDVTRRPGTEIFGQSGATLQEVLPLLESLLEEKCKPSSITETLTVIFCAGENDIGQNVRLDETLINFQKLLEMMAPLPQIKPPKKATKDVKRHLIVLGPKFEPWLEYDANCRKQYAKLSMAMERACKKHVLAMQDARPERTAHFQQVSFVDCLVMFCGKSGKQPGATLGGKAMPDKGYFDHDLLHLSRRGYQLWKEVTERLMDRDSRHFYGC